MNRQELFQEINYCMDQEGFQYCFNGYDDWEEVDDPKFHELKVDFIRSAQRLEEYVRLQSGELTEDDCTFTLSFGTFDDCCCKDYGYGPIHKELSLKEKNYESLKVHIEDIIKTYREANTTNYKDGTTSCYVEFFDDEYLENKERYHDWIVRALLNSNQCVANGIEKYYSIGFAINFEPLVLYAKDCPQTLYKWDVPRSVNEVSSDIPKQYQEYEPSKDSVDICDGERLYESDDGW